MLHNRAVEWLQLNSHVHAQWSPSPSYGTWSPQPWSPGQQWTPSPSWNAGVKFPLRHTSQTALRIWLLVACSICIASLYAAIRHSGPYFDKTSLCSVAPLRILNCPYCVVRRHRQLHTVALHQEPGLREAGRPHQGVGLRADGRPLQALGSSPPTRQCNMGPPTQQWTPTPSKTPSPVVSWNMPLDHAS